ncbi:hypothetical protein KIW84_020367 [Lathyrus oleraceus]|uniref:Uncharacterized protein n=1 Tax=Pisum sativum TaxID=3888 RepID=A0A9D4Y648_PEA|nr:hypothetical protein KIW84_020367 [Pisum sativum]
MLTGMKFSGIQTEVAFRPVFRYPDRSGIQASFPKDLNQVRFMSGALLLCPFLPLSLHQHLCNAPTCYSQAVKDARTTMNNELQALQENFTWDIVPRPPGVKPIGSNKQESGVNYDETSVPVAKMTSIRTKLTIAASQG